MDFKDLRKYAKENNIPIIKPQTENLLKLFTEIKKPQKILEIGTAIGFSAAVMLLCGNENSKIYSIELDENRYILAKQNLKQMGLLKRAELFLGDATEIIPNLTGSYDMIFVDGPKGQYINFLPYLLNVLNCGGLLVCDNVLYRGLVDGKVKMRKKSVTMINNLRLFLDEIKNNTNLTTHIFDIDDGISVSIKKL